MRRGWDKQSLRVAGGRGVMWEQTSNRLRSGFVGFSFRWIGGNFVCADLMVGIGVNGWGSSFQSRLLDVLVVFGCFLCLAGGWDGL